MIVVILPFQTNPMAHKMKKYLCKLILIFIVTLGVAASPSAARAYVALLDGETDEEVALNNYILECNNEVDVFTYLSDLAASVREAACIKLGEIGTAYSLSALEDIVIDETENYAVRKEAAFALWKIRYREEIAAGGDGESVLLEIVGLSDVTKTPEVIAWAIELLGNMGSLNAVPYLEALIAATEHTPFLEYLQEKAQEGLTKINFITNTAPEDQIDLGLEHSQLCVRKWALRALVEEDPPDLLDRLNLLLAQAQTNQDDEFASYIAETIQETTKKTKYPPIEFLCPPDAITLKTAYAQIMGYTFGEPFCDTIELVDGWNTYTKTVTDEDGNLFSESITIYHANEPPVLEPIGNQEILVGETLTFTISAADPDDADLLYFAFELPGEASFDDQAQGFSWTPDYADLGPHTVTFMAWDCYGLIDEEAITITVNNTNQPPALDPIGDKEIFEGQTLNFTVTASDPDADRVYYYLASYDVEVDIEHPEPDGDVDMGDLNLFIQAYGSRLGDPLYVARADFDQDDDVDFDDVGFFLNRIAYPQGLSFNSRTGEFSWTPNFDQQGAYNLTFSAYHYDFGSRTYLFDSEAIVINVNQAPAQVTGQHIFYNNSVFDGNDMAANEQDDNAIAPDKEALRPAGTASFTNYTSYSRGINGIMIDIENLANVEDLNIGNLQQYFQFRVGNNNNPEGWQAAPSPTSVEVRRASGMTDTQRRVTLIWEDNAIRKEWLEVKVLANSDTGLANEDIFYFGNAVAEAGNSTLDAQVTATDLLLVRNNPRNFLNPAEITFNYDYNRDAMVNSTDMLLARNNQTNFLNVLRLIELEE